MTQPGQNFRRRPAVILLRPRPRRQRRFRWEWIWLLLGLIVFFYILKSIRISFSFDEIMSALHVSNPFRYRQLCILGILVTTIVAVVKVLRHK